MNFGVTPEGFVRRRLADIRPEIENTLRVTFGNQINLLPESVFGQIIAVFSERESLLWELSEAIYNSFDPNSAVGTSLDNIGSITGASRLNSAPSVVLAQRLFGTPGTVIEGGTQIAVSGAPGLIFQTTTEVTLGDGQNEEQEISFSSIPTVGTYRLNFRGSDTIDLNFDSSSEDIQNAIAILPFGEGISVSGNAQSVIQVSFQGDSGLQEQPLLLVDDNTLQNGSVAIDIEVARIQQGVNQAEVNVEAVNNGPLVANAGTLTDIITLTSGLNRVINISDAILGREIEEDNEFRDRRLTTVQSSGVSTTGAISSSISNILGVSSAIVFENETDIEDDDGRPPNSYEVLVSGGNDQEILDAVFRTKPSGIRTVGNITGSVIDSQGQTQTVSFSRPVAIPVFTEIDLTIDPSLFPSNGIASVEQALVNRGNAFGIGQDVIVSPSLICSIDGIPGIIGASIRVGISPSPDDDLNIPIAANEFSMFDTSTTTAVIL